MPGPEDVGSVQTPTGTESKGPCEVCISSLHPGVHPNLCFKSKGKKENIPREIRNAKEAKGGLPRSSAAM